MLGPLSLEIRSLLFPIYSRCFGHYGFYETLLLRLIGMQQHWMKMGGHLEAKLDEAYCIGVEGFYVHRIVYGHEVPTEFEVLLV